MKKLLILFAGFFLFTPPQLFPQGTDPETLAKKYSDYTPREVFKLYYNTTNDLNRQADKTLQTVPRNEDIGPAGTTTCPDLDFNYSEPYLGKFRFTGDLAKMGRTISANSTVDISWSHFNYQQANVVSLNGHKPTYYATKYTLSLVQLTADQNPNNLTPVFFGRNRTNNATQIDPCNYRSYDSNCRRSEKFEIGCPPISAGIYIVSVTATSTPNYFTSVNDKPHSCTITTYFTVLPEIQLIPPIPVVKVTCDTGTVKITVENTQNADELRLYEEVTSENPIRTILPASEGNYFKFDVKVHTLSEAYQMAFYKDFEDCVDIDGPQERIKESVKSPLVILMLNQFIPEELPKLVDAEVLKGPEIVNGADLSRHILKVFTKNDPEIEPTMNPDYDLSNIRNLKLNPKMVWTSEDGTISTDYINNQGKIEYVTWHDLPDRGGSCATYKLKIEVTPTFDFYDNNGNKIRDYDNEAETCFFDFLQQDVCKFIPAPPSKLVVSCEKMDYASIPNPENYNGLLWSSVFHDDNTCHDGFLFNNHNKGFLFLTEDSDPNSFLRSYVGDKGRKGAPSKFQIIILSNGKIEISDTIGIQKPTISDPNHPLYCTETNTYIPLTIKVDKSLNKARQNYSNLKNQLPEIEFLPNSPGKSLEESITLRWSPREHIFEYYDPILETIQERVCYYNLPSEPNSSRNYFGMIHADLTIKGYDQEYDLIDFKKCDAKQTLNAYKQSLVSDPNCELEFRNNVDKLRPNEWSSCETINFIQACPDEDYEIGNSAGDAIPGHNYQWGHGPESSTTTISYDNHLNQTADNDFKRFTQTVNSSTTNLETYNNCYYFFKCRDCSGSHKTHEIGEENSNDFIYYRNGLVVFSDFGLVKSQPITYSITNISGQEILTGKFQIFSRNGINVFGLKNGVYLLNLNENGRNISKKFIIF